MNVTINGENQTVPEGFAVLGLIEHLKLGEQRLAIEVNGEIVPKSRYAEHRLHEGDRIEIVHAIGGGAFS